MILNRFTIEARDPASHGDMVACETIIRWRNRLLGVGGECVIGRVAQVQRR